MRTPQQYTGPRSESQIRRRPRRAKDNVIGLTHVRAAACKSDRIAVRVSSTAKKRGWKRHSRRKRKLFTISHLNARGDLKPISGFYFPLFSMVFPGGISIRVENRGFWWNAGLSLFHAAQRPERCPPSLCLQDLKLSSPRSEAFWRTRRYELPARPASRRWPRESRSSHPRRRCRQSISDGFCSRGLQRIGWQRGDFRPSGRRMRNVQNQ
jgi:hypothetical protein